LTKDDINDDTKLNDFSNDGKNKGGEMEKD
jgi:hypothetical protein